MKKLLIALFVFALVLVPILGTAHATEQDWTIAKGYGTAKGTGAGLSEEDGSLLVGGFGEMCYTKQSVREAVAVRFRIYAYPTTTHYFYFGLMDTAEKMWNTGGTMAKGLVGRVVVATGGETINMSALNTGATGTTTLATVTPQIRALGSDHLLVIYREDDLWHIVIDGVLAARVPVTSTSLAEESHFIVGSYNSAVMEMEIKDVFLDGEVTDEMKDGTFIKELVGDGAQLDTYYDDEGRLIVGDTVVNSVGTYEAPAYGVKDMLLVISGGDRPWVPYMLLGAGVATVLSAVMFIVEAVKSSKRKKKSKEASA